LPRQAQQQRETAADNGVYAAYYRRRGVAVSLRAATNQPPPVSLKLRRLGQVGFQGSPRGTGPDHVTLLRNSVDLV